MDLIDCCRSKTPGLGGGNDAKVFAEDALVQALREFTGRGAGLSNQQGIVKLLAHPVRTGQARRDFAAM